MKDDDSDVDVLEDRESDSDGEDNRPFRPRSMKGFMTAGTDRRHLWYYHPLNRSHNEHDGLFMPADCGFCLLGRDARVIGSMQGGDSDQVSSFSRVHSLISQLCFQFLCVLWFSNLTHLLVYMCLKPTVAVSGRLNPHAKKVRQGKVCAGAEAHSDFVILCF